MMTDAKRRATAALVRLRAGEARTMRVASRMHHQEHDPSPTEPDVQTTATTSDHRRGW